MTRWKKQGYALLAGQIALGVFWIYMDDAFTVPFATLSFFMAGSILYTLVTP